MLLDRRKKTNELEHFLISADQKLISWLHEAFPGQKSLADFPSAWLSIILKYGGREKETDYKAFCQFIHLSIEPHTDDLEKKIELKAAILSSDMDDDLKTMMINEVKDNYPRYQEHETKEILKIAFGKTKESIESEVERKKTEEADLEFAKIFSSMEKERKQNQENIDKIIATAKEEKRQSYQKGFNEAYERIKEEQLEKAVKDTLKRNIVIRKIIAVSFWIFLVLCAIAWVLFYLKGYLSSQSKLGLFFQNNSLFFGGITSLLELALWGLKYFIKKRNFLPISEPSIKAILLSESKVE